MVKNINVANVVNKALIPNVITGSLNLKDVKGTLMDEIHPADSFGVIMGLGFTYATNRRCEGGVPLTVDVCVDQKTKSRLPRINVIGPGALEVVVSQGFNEGKTLNDLSEFILSKEKTWSETMYAFEEYEFGVFMRNTKIQWDIYFYSFN